ncbi:hypothetical protein [Clostridium sp.]|uniref:hypothetical protein n=1 Tax=Clostridium sp. TaxID=1506 RepID=UPI0026DC57EF|nr:hypothetical protein [Clostridium sp.]MDO5039784.1 hypothetical protein [Clostridium sp.]
MTEKESIKNMEKQLAILNNQVKMLEILTKNSSSCEEILNYFGEESSDYIENIIRNASQVLGN